MENSFRLIRSRRQLNIKSASNVDLMDKSIRQRVALILRTAFPQNNYDKYIKHYDNEFDQIENLVGELEEVAKNHHKYSLDWAFENAEEKLDSYVDSWKPVNKIVLDEPEKVEEEEGDLLFRSYLSALCFDEEESIKIEAHDEENFEDRYSSYLNILGFEEPVNHTYDSEDQGISNNSKINKILKQNKFVDSVSGKFFKFLSVIITLIEIVLSVCLVMIVSEISHSGQSAMGTHLQSIIFALTFAFLKVILEMYVLRPKVEKFGWKLYNSIVEENSNYFVAIISLRIILREKIDKEKVISDYSIEQVVAKVLNAFN